MTIYELCKRSIEDYVSNVYHVSVNRKEVIRIRKVVWAHYRTHGRHDLPWRKTTDPYRILVSETMLQQTQVARVVSKYDAFVKRFPSVDALALAPLAEVLVAWQGLGYNRRAKMLHEAVKEVVTTYGGVMPGNYEELLRLRGVGPYTARAVCVFAYNRGGGMVETNIRTVLFHTLFADKTDVPDAELLPITVALCPKGKAREWYSALMDYGAYLKEQGVRVNSKSKHYTKQPAFEGSDRQIRGMILRLLSREQSRTERALLQNIPAPRERVQKQLETLAQEGFIHRQRGAWSLYERVRQMRKS